jgi:hypothetical protein
VTVQGTAGLAVPLEGNFLSGGVLTDASAITLDITYGAPYQATADYAGPFTWSGATSPVPGQVWHSGTGQYQFTWQIPAAAPAGVYVATWTFTYSGTQYQAAENVWVQGGTPPPVPAGDVGYWTGGIINALAGLDIDLGQVDSNGTAWLWQSITGWDSPPVQGSGVIPRSGDHGAWPSPQYYAARTLTLTATASAVSQALRDVARAQLQQAVPVGSDGNLAVLRYDEPVPKQALVRRSGQVTEKYPTLCDVTFTIGLVAPDPRKYGTIQKQLPIIPAASGGGGGLVVPFTVPFTLDPGPPPSEGYCTNAGNFNSPPVVVITGPVDAPALANLTTGETVYWSQASIPAGQSMTVDFLNRQAWIGATAAPGLPGQPLDGTYQPADLFSAWWTLQPGQNLILFAGQDTGTGTGALICYYDSWM